MSTRYQLRPGRRSPRRIQILRATLVGIALLALAIPLTLRQASAGSSTLQPTDDSYTSQSNPTGTHGDQASLNTNAAIIANERRSYLKFAVTGIPAGSRNLTAVLSLYSQSYASPSVVFTVSQTATTWDEGTLTWNNQPPIGAIVTSRDGLADGYRNNFDLSSLVTGNGVYSIAIRSSDPRQRYFSSKEATGEDAYPPQLQLNWSDPIAPVVTTGSASAVGTTTATLGGTVNPEGQATTCHAEYGTTSTYGSSTTDTTIPAGWNAVDAATRVSDLSAGTDYHYRTVCTNAAGTTDGADAVFTTVAPAPTISPMTVTTGTATDITYVAAAVNGTVNPAGTPATCAFDYGPTTDYGLTTPSQSVGPGTSDTPTSAELTGLSPNTTYHYRLDCTGSSNPITGADATFTTSNRDLLTRTDLIYGTEIPYNLTNGGPAVDTATPLPADIRAAKAEVVRFSLHDCFQGETCGWDNHAGTRAKADLDNEVKGIVDTLRAVPMLKLLPISPATLSTDSQLPAVNGQSFCPPYDGSNDTLDLPVFESQLREIASVYKGPIILESSNEMENDCYSLWKTQPTGSAITGEGSAGVSKRLGEIYAATMPALKQYARSLGFSQVVTVGYIGVGGGGLNISGTSKSDGWGANCQPGSGTAPYDWDCTYKNNWVGEFNAALYSKYLAAAQSADAAVSATAADYIPDAESIHAYPHSPDFTTTIPGYDFNDDAAYSYYHMWIQQVRGAINTAWNSTSVGSNMRFAISEWNAGICRTTSACWSGWSSPASIQAFYGGWMSMLHGDGNLNGSRFWEASNFVATGNGTSGPGAVYNMLNPVTYTAAPQYDTWKAASVDDTAAH